MLRNTPDLIKGETKPIQYSEYLRMDSQGILYRGKTSKLE